MVLNYILVGCPYYIPIPSVVSNYKRSDLHNMNDKLKIWKEDFPIHVSLLNEIKEWKRHWTLQQPQEDPTTSFECLDHAAGENRCTLSLGSAGAERSFSCLQRLKTYLRNGMGEDRLFSLEFMIIHHEFKVNIDKVIEEFEKTNNRRLISGSLLCSTDYNQVNPDNLLTIRQFSYDDQNDTLLLQNCIDTVQSVSQRYKLCCIV